MKKKQMKLNDKTIGLLIGIVVTVGIVSAFSISFAHVNSEPNGMMHNENMMQHMMDSDASADMNHMQMHSKMHGSCGMMSDSDGMGCTSMMKSHDMTKEEIDAMLSSMDKDGDGMCDMCGMSVEHCGK